MAGNGASGRRLDNFPEGVQFFYQRNDLIDNFLRNSGVGHKDPVIIHLTGTFQPAPDIIQNGFFHRSPVEPANMQCAVLHDDFRAKLQHIGTKPGDTIAASALVQVIQCLQNEAHIQISFHFIQRLGDIGAVITGRSQLCR